ncbi:MAG TPA: VanZ family protein [Terriglobia bacterium]|nr:VanZ family protein [Terriglobia bacterium]
MKKLVLEYWAPLLVWIVTIFVFSTDAFSSNETSKIIVPILAFFFPGLGPQELDVWHGVIRKLGHITEYFILAVFTYRSIRADQPDLAQAKLRTITFVVLAASFDEIHQRFTAFRTPSPVDVGYDCLGAVWALWLITSYENWRLRSHPVL